MGSVITRGTRDDPHYFVKYKDVDGRWKMRLSKQETKDQAKTYLRQVEGRVARGLVGIPEPEDTPLAGTLLDTWQKALAAKHIGAHPEKKVTRHGRTEKDSTKPMLTFYQATRHSFVSRNLQRGVPLDEVSSAVGHSSPVVTRRYYDHFVRKTFSSEIRVGIGTKKTKGSAAIIPMRPTGDDPPPVSTGRRAGNGAGGRRARRV